MKKIVLASSSPRRKALLEQIGLVFTVEPRVTEGADFTGDDPHLLARQISLEKAKSAARYHPDAVIIAADTIGVIAGRIIGKPRSELEARQILSLLGGKAHSVITGFTVLDTGSGKTVSRSVETAVYMKRMTEPEIEAYVRTGEPLDKAGAYAIQGLGAVLVEKIEGDFFNVMGLPLAALTESLKEFGIDVL